MATEHMAGGDIGIKHLDPRLLEDEALAHLSHSLKPVATSCFIKLTLLLPSLGEEMIMLPFTFLCWISSQYSCNCSTSFCSCGSATWLSFSLAFGKLYLMMSVCSATLNHNTP